MLYTEVDKLSNKVMAGPFESEELPIFEETAPLMAVEANIEVFIGMYYKPEDGSFFMDWEYVRSVRDHMLLNTDPSQLEDYPVDRMAWRAYREELRNIPQVHKDANSVVWPEAPEQGIFRLRY